MNINIQGTTVHNGSRVFAGVQIYGDYVAGEASLQERIIKWLDPIDPYPIQNLLRAQCTPGTGEIFLKEQYRTWLASENRLLWLHGEAGSGKTFLSSLIADRTSGLLSSFVDEKDCKHTVAFFYCSFQESTTQIAINFLKSVNAQLFVKHKRFEQLKDLYERDRSFGSASQSDLCTALAAIAMNPNIETADQVSLKQCTSQSTITILLDGLDQVPLGDLRKQYFNVIDALAKLQAPQLRIVVVSRFQTVIKNCLKEHLGWKHMSRTLDDVESDVDIFNEGQISQNEILSGLGVHLKRTIRSRLGQGRPGMFRLAALQMRELCDFTQSYDTSEDVEEDKIKAVLNEMPPELDLFYDRIVRRIRPLVRRQLEVALRWIAFASRPLFVEEVIAACSIETNRAGSPFMGKQIVDVKIALDNLRGMVELRPALPAPFVISLDLDPKSYTFQFIHQTVKEYLFPHNADRPVENDGIRFDATIAHKHLTRSCLFYLSRCARHPEGRSCKFPLREYAWYYWSMHFACLTDPDASTARPTLESMRLHNSIVHPQLYEADENLQIQHSYAKARFDEFIRFLDAPAQNALRRAIRDTSFPGNMPKEEWDWNAVWSLTGESSGFSRLVILQPSKEPWSEVVCSLLTDSLDNNPRYEALTWTWGEPENVEHGIVVNNCMFYVRPNLLRCLRYMRSETEHRVLWIDSVTINMFDFAERSQQVDTMARIYSSAVRSVIYIGDWEEDTTVNILELLACGSEHRDLKIIEATKASTPLAAWLQYVLTRPLWKRIWVVQEIAAARKAICYVGAMVLHWEELNSIMNQYGQLILGTGKISSPASEHIQDADDLFKDWQAFQSIGNIVRRHVTQAWIPLPQILWMTRLHKASIQVDQIYALRHFLHPEERDHPLLSVDYTLSTQKLYNRLATYIIRTYRNLDILSYVKERREKIMSIREAPQPSWVPRNFEQPTFCPGIFNPEQPEIYNAGGRQLRAYSISSDHSALHVEGIFIDRLESILHRAIYGLTYEDFLGKDWSRIFQKDYADHGSIIGYGPSPAIFSEACRRTYCADRCVDSEGLVMRIPKHLERPDSDSRLKWLCHDVSQKAIGITRRGKLVLVPYHVREGDQIVVLFGAMVPFFIRDTRKSSWPNDDDDDDNDNDDDVPYKLLGECYVHGIMGGEILRAHEAGDCKSQLDVGFF